MSLEIDGLLRGRDMGYSVRHPDHSYLDEFCCCEERHCHLPGETPKERHHYATLMIAAPEMLELISNLSQAYDDRQSGHELASRLYDLRCMALRLLAKIEGGGE